jgi:hypothetical protein
MTSDVAVAVARRDQRCVIGISSFMGGAATASLKKSKSKPLLDVLKNSGRMTDQKLS